MDQVTYVLVAKVPEVSLLRMPSLGPARAWVWQSPESWDTL